MLLLAAAGLSSALIGSAELALATAEQQGVAAGYVAQAFLERAIGDLRLIADWNQVLGGVVVSSLADGAPAGLRPLPLGTGVVNLDGVRHQATCGQPAPCTEADMNASTAERPWGINNPRWRLFAYGPASALLPGQVESAFYGLVLVGDDGMEEDGRPEVDGAPGTPGAGVLWLRAIAVGTAGARTTIDAAVERPTVGGAPAMGRPLRLRAWVRRSTTPAWP
jgi:hypothetical protein